LFGPPSQRLKAWGFSSKKTRKFNSKKTLKDDGNGRKENDPFPFWGFGFFSGLNSMLNFQGVVSHHPNSTRNNYFSQLGTLKVTHAPAKALGTLPC